MKAPKLVTFSGDEVDAPPPPPGGTYRLLVRRALYDSGSLVEGSASFAPLVAEPALFVNSATLSEIGAEKGSEVRVITAAASIELPVSIDDSLPKNVAALTANLVSPGAFGSNALIDSSLATIDVSLEPA